MFDEDDDPLANFELGDYVLTEYDDPLANFELGGSNYGSSTYQGFNFGPSTLEASFPLASKRKGSGLGKTLDTVERMTGVRADWLDSASKHLEEYGEENLQDYRPVYTDESFLESGDKPGWIGETIQSQVGEMGVTYGLSYLGNILPGMAGTAVKALNVGQAYTSLVDEAYEEIARKSGITIEQLSDKQKNKAQFTAGVNTALELFAPRNLGKNVKKYNFSSDHKKNLKTFDRITKDVKRQGIGKIAKETAKGAGKIGLQEAGTEYLQGVTTSLASQSGIGYEVSTEGLTEAVDRIVGGAAGGTTFGSPSALSQARQSNKLLNLSEQRLREQNRRNLLQAGQQFREKGIEYQPYQYEIPERRKTFRESFLKKKMPNLLGDISTGTPKHYLYSRATDLFQRKLENLDKTLEDGDGNKRKATGRDVDLLMNRLFGRFGDVETMSGDYQGRNSFQSLRHNYQGEFIKPIDTIFNRWRSGGNLLGKFDPAIEAYVKARLEDKDVTPYLKDLPEGIDIAQLDADAVVIKKTTDNIYEALKKTLAKSNLDIGYTKGYIPRGVDRKAIEANREGFIESLKKDVGIPESVARKIARDIIEGRDPSTMSAEEINIIRQGKGRKGKGREGFEKKRTERWDKLSEEFRTQSVFESIQDYTYKASERLASAEAFGGDKANELMKDIDEGLRSKLLSESDAKTIMDMYDAEHKRYGLPDEGTPAEKLTAFSRLSSHLAAVQYLGLAVISSIPELAHMPARVGLINTLKAAPLAAGYALKGAAQTLHPGKTGAYLDNSFAKDVIQTLGYSLNPTMHDRAEALMQGEVNPFMNLWFRSPAGGFLTQYTNFVRAWTAVAGLQMIQNEANKLAKGNMTAHNMMALKRELRENGLQTEDLKQLHRIGKGTIDILNDEYLNTKFTKADGTVTRVRDVLVPWMTKIVSDVALEPGASNRPLWMSNPQMQLFSQLKSFPVVFANTIMKRTYKQLNPKHCTPGLQEGFAAIFSVAAALGLAAMSVEIKKAIRGSDKETGIMDVIAGAGVPYIGTASFKQAATSPGVSAMDNVFTPILSEFNFEGVMEIIVRATGGALFAEQLDE